MLTTADFRTQNVNLRTVASDAVTVTGSSGQEQRIALDRFLLLKRSDTHLQNNARFVAVFGDDDHLPGQPRSIEGQNLLWVNPLVGDLKLPLNSIRAIVRSVDAQQAAAASPGTEDVVTLINGDAMRGIIATLDGAAVTIQQPTGEQSKVPLETIRKIVFAAIGPATAQAPKHARMFHVSLADGSDISAASMQQTGNTLALTLPDGLTHAVAMTAVNSIEQINGPVVWLSSLPPAESVNRSLLDLTWQPRMNRAVDGEPIQFDEQTYTRGIGVHAYSRLSFVIDPAWVVFRTQYAIAGDLPYANVTVRIKLDGQVVHEMKDVRAGMLSQPVVVMTGGHKTLSLEVDYGENYDVQDRFNWIEPAFLKFDPKSP